MIIKVLGPGCNNCRRLERNVIEAVERLSLDATVVKVTDLEEMMQYGMLGSPGLVVDDKLVSVGKVLSTNEIINLIKGS